MFVFNCSINHIIQWPESIRFIHEGFKSFNTCLFYVSHYFIKLFYFYILDPLSSSQKPLHELDANMLYFLI